MSTANTSGPLTVKKSRTMDIEEDSIIDLPIEIRDTILSLLTAKEAAVTCTLSRRWKSLWDNWWCFCLNLNFDFHENLKLDDHFHAWELRHTPQCQFLFPDFDKLTKQRLMYVAYVNRILDNHRGTNIDQFRVSFDLDIDYRLQINKWVRFAMRKKAKVLQLHLFSDHPVRQRYNFPMTLLGCQKFNFKSLQVLEFKYVNVRGEIVEYLLIHCPVLERLIVHNSDTLGELRVQGSSLKLKHLEIQNSFASLKICNVPELTLFYVSGGGINLQNINFTINNVPKLVEVSMPMIDYFFSKLLACASQLQVLRLNLFYLHSGQPVLPPRFPVLKNLKHLELSVHILGHYNQELYSFLEACPSLQTIVFKMPLELEPRAQFLGDEWYPQRQIHSLKEVKLLGYIGSQTDIALFNFFMKNAVSLQKFVVDTRKYYKFYRSDKDLEEEKKARTHAMKLLKPQVPSTVEFLCL